MHEKVKTFIFEDFNFDPQPGRLALRYSIDEKLNFEEVWNFPIVTLNQFTNNEGKLLPQIQNALQGLWIMCGISYYKTYLPKNIVIKGDQLSKSQAEFFDKIYLHGLGEFFYENKFDPRGLVKFPFGEARELESEEAREPFKLNGTMIAVGGGKDSLTTIEILKQQLIEDQKNKSLKDKKSFPLGKGWDGGALSTWSVGHGELFAPMLETIGLPHTEVKRKICPNLLNLYKSNQLTSQPANPPFNGHVPISAILAFSSVITALLTGKKYIALSNESSANEANVEMYGMKINHQYSKTLEFEQDFQSYVTKNISNQVQYFSFLRPLKEIQIAQNFCSKCFDKYLGNFSSCNKNFKLSRSSTSPLPHSFHWCSQCSKCAFVACIFAPFLDRDQMHELFGCEIFGQETILKFIPELLGQTEHKPFECVGEYTEVQYAINQAVETGNWPELEPFVDNEFEDKTMLNNFSKHSMPEEFELTLKENLKLN